MNQTSGIVENFIKNSTTLLIYPLFFPFILMFYAITSSIMNKDLGAVIYIFGLIITLINNYLINSGSVVRDKSTGLRSEFCYMGIPFVPKFNMRSSPNMGVITYTLFFFLAPSFIRNLHYMRNPLALMEYMFDKNKLLLIFFGITMVCNYYSEKFFGCSNPAMYGLDIMNGFFVGLFSAWLMILLFYVTGHKNLLLTSKFLDNKVLCVIPNNKIFKCKNDNNISAIAFSMTASENVKYDEKFYYGDRDLARLDGMKMANSWKYVHIYGVTDFVVYKYPDFKGDKILIKYRDMKQKIKRDDSIESNRYSDEDNYSKIIYKWENYYINGIKNYNKNIYDTLRGVDNDELIKLKSQNYDEIIEKYTSIYPIGDNSNDETIDNDDIPTNYFEQRDLTSPNPRALDNEEKAIITNNTNIPKLDNNITNIELKKIIEKKIIFIEKNKKILVQYSNYDENSTTNDVTVTTKLEDEILNLLGKGILDVSNSKSKKIDYITLTKEDIINKCLWNKSRCSEKPLLSQEDSNTETIGSIQLIKSKD